MPLSRASSGSDTYASFGDLSDSDSLDIDEDACTYIRSQSFVITPTFYTFGLGLGLFFCGIGMYLHARNQPANSTNTTSQTRVSNSKQHSIRGQRMSDSLFVMIMGCILVSFGMFYVVVFCIIIPIRRRRQAIRELELARKKMKDRPSHDLFRRSRSSMN